MPTAAVAIRVFRGGARPLAWTSFIEPRIFPIEQPLLLLLAEGWGEGQLFVP
ncbi:hypothetical protein BH18VER1_BH18VER1_21560 [soil metagenome]